MKPWMLVSIQYVMRKFLVLVLLFSIRFNAVEARMRLPQIGFQMGPSMSTIYGSPMVETFMKNQLGFCAGPSLYYPVSKRFSVKTNLLFETKGAAGITPYYEKGALKGMFNTEVNYRYLTIPVLFNLTFGSRFKYELSTGPYMGFLLGQKTIWSNPTGGEDINNKDMSVYRPGDGGWIFGTGCRYYLNNRWSVNMEFRWNAGLSNIASKPVMNSYSIHNLSTSALFGIHYTPGYMAGKARRNWDL